VILSRCAALLLQTLLPLLLCCLSMYLLLLLQVCVERREALCYMLQLGGWTCTNLSTNRIMLGQLKVGLSDAKYYAYCQ
jgi:hypothetical protein